MRFPSSPGTETGILHPSAFPLSLLVMRSVSLLALVALAVETLSAPTPYARYVLHEKRDALPYGWSKREKMQNDITLPMKIALKQSNLNKLDDYLMDVSSPDSGKYGKHWSHRKIADTFAPTEETHNAVREWLSSSGISKERIRASKSNAEAERLLNTEYYFYEHASGEPTVACEQYDLPQHISEHIGQFNHVAACYYISCLFHVYSCPPQDSELYPVQKLTLSRLCQAFSAFRQPPIA